MEAIAFYEAEMHLSHEKIVAGDYQRKRYMNASVAHGKDKKADMPERHITVTQMSVLGI